jgi:hypothetical protein
LASGRAAADFDVVREGLMFVGGAALGAGALLLLDPRQGRRRRARAVQKLRHGAHALLEGSAEGARDLAHRAQGKVAEVRSRLHQEGAVADEILEERVRAKLGRVCAHPSAITVRSRGDRVELTGPILRADVDRVLRAVRRVPGVEAVDNRMEVHEHEGHIPLLQRRPHPVGHYRETLTPASRLVTGIAGSALLTAGVATRGWAAWPFRVLGIALLARAATNHTLGPFLSITGARVASAALDLASHRTEAALEVEPATPAPDAPPR